MKTTRFHHPDWCAAVVRRKVADDLLDFLTDVAPVLFRRSGYRVETCFPSRAAYYSAMYRLRKAGLIAYRRTGGRMPVLQLTDSGESRVSPACRRTPPWPRDWNGLWYLLSFDVPEKHREYRNVLRAFPQTMRMECLHKSVWASPIDTRPEYAD